MAAQFPSNFNDGEHFLMYDFFINPHLRHQQRQNQHLHHQHLPCMDELSHHFTTLSLPPHGQSPHNFELERFKPPFQSGAVSARPQLPGHFGANGGRELSQRIDKHRAWSFSSGRKPVYDVQFLKQTPAQLEAYMRERTNRVFQRQQNRLLQQNQGLPYQGSGLSLNGGLLREYGGTGVFHPRISAYATGVSTASVAKNQSVECRKKIPATQQKYSTKRLADVPSNQEEYHLPPDMGLPRDWTY